MSSDEPTDEPAWHWEHVPATDAFWVYDAGRRPFAWIGPDLVPGMETLWSMNVGPVLTEHEAHALLHIAMGALARMRGLPDGESFALLDPYLGYEDDAT
jgi:hypothetical protein